MQNALSARRVRVKHTVENARDRRIRSRHVLVVEHGLELVVVGFEDISHETAIRLPRGGATATRAARDSGREVFIVELAAVAWVVRVQGARGKGVVRVTTVHVCTRLRSRTDQNQRERESRT